MTIRFENWWQLEDLSSNYIQLLSFGYQWDEYYKGISITLFNFRISIGKELL